MPELPTAATPSTTPEVARALAAIEAAKLADPDIAECLDAIGDMIRITGQPETVYDWVAKTLGREHLKQFAIRHRLDLFESSAVGEEYLDRSVIIWTADGRGMAIIPTGQAPATTVLQLREEIAQREQEVRMCLDFQASVAAGHVEDVETWHARTARSPE